MTSVSARSGFNFRFEAQLAIQTDSVKCAHTASDAITEQTSQNKAKKSPPENNNAENGDCKFCCSPSISEATSVLPMATKRE